jgi:SulP family sulfate permease
MLIALGVARLGSAIKFIPYPVITSFTSGIAIIIFSTQIKDPLGLDKSPAPRPTSRTARRRRSPAWSTR